MTFKDLALGYIAVAPDPADSGLSFELQSGEGSMFVQPSTEGDFYCTCFPPGVYPSMLTAEIVKVTARTDDEFTIVRAQKDTTAKEIAVGWIVLQGIYADDVVNSASFITGEVPAGSINGSNTVFTLSQTPASETLKIYHNRTRLKETDDYTVDGDEITLVVAPLTGDALIVDYQLAVPGTGNADTLDGFHANSTPTANNIPVLDDNALLPIVAINPIHRLNAQEGFLINGKIVPSVASNNLTVAIKGLDGNDPSATNPVYIMLGGVLRSITSALSVTKNAGTNYFNSGGAELATKEVDYFVYLGYNATDGVTIGFSRIAYANLYSDFSATSTNSLYCAISTITNAAAGDNYTVIGRFAATLSAGAGYTWTVPTFTTKNLIQRPIYETRFLDFVPTKTTSGGAYTNQPVTNYAKYKFIRERCLGYMKHTHNATPGGSGRASYTLPIGVVAVMPASSGYDDSDFTQRTAVLASNLLLDNKYDGTYGVSGNHVHLHKFDYPFA